MEKVKLAVWGITKDIWHSLKNTIDMRKSTICFFIDGKIKEEADCFESYPTYPFGEGTLKRLANVEYVLIAAYSGYRKIRNMLIENGVSPEKIQLYITPGIKMYHLGDLTDISRELIYKIYFEPEKRWGEVCEYQRAYMEIVENFDSNRESERWFEKGTLISHACGGFVNGQKLMYSNSKEALAYSFSKGFQLIECDLLGAAQKEIVLAHNFDAYYEAMQKKYTMQDVETMLMSLKLHPGVHMLVDVKWSFAEEYDVYISHILNCILRVSDNSAEIKQLKQQIVMEVYDEESMRSAQKAGFEMFFTQYRNENIENIIETVRLCLKYQIGAVGYDISLIEKYAKSIPLLKANKIKIFVYSSDSVEEYKRLRMLGVDGIFTNYLTDADINV